jgi:drug/metabolite transporter (DMT)-like permease
MHVGALLVLFFAFFVALWPVACVFTALHHAFAKRWSQVVRLALLVPLWAVAPIVGLIELAPFLATPKSPEQSSYGFSVVSIGLAVVCCSSAWWLLFRSLQASNSRTTGSKSSAKQDAV